MTTHSPSNHFVQLSTTFIPSVNATSSPSYRKTLIPTSHTPTNNNNTHINNNSTNDNNNNSTNNNGNTNTNNTNNNNRNNSHSHPPTNIPSKIYHDGKPIRENIGQAKYTFNLMVHSIFIIIILVLY